MRKPLLFLPALLFFVNSLLAQTTYTYFFDNNLHDGSGPDLISACSGTYSSETLPYGTTRNVYHFTKGCGLTFDDSMGGFLSSGSYTIEMYVRLDTIQGYKKLIDFKNRTADKGLYNQTGKLVLYSLTSSNDSLIPDSQFVYIALTRDATTKKLVGYVNSRVDTVWSDPDTDYVYNDHKKLIFLQDDAGTGGEQTSGTISMLKITNAAIDSNTMKTRFGKLEVPALVNQNNTMQIYPNPVSNTLHILSPVASAYIINDITGRQILAGTISVGDNSINFSASPGLYFIRLYNNAGEQVYKISKN